MAAVNPELMRNWWLEMPTIRLIGAPVVLGAIMGALEVLDMPHTTREGIVRGFLFVLLGVWGARRAATAVADDVRHNSWDAQRTSGMTARGLAFGKLFGSTLFIWYAALIPLAMVVWLNVDLALSQPPRPSLLSAGTIQDGTLTPGRPGTGLGSLTPLGSAAPETASPAAPIAPQSLQAGTAPPPTGDWTVGLRRGLVEVLQLVLIGIAAQAAALALSLALLRKQRMDRRFRVATSHGAGLLLALGLSQLLLLLENAASLSGGSAGPATAVQMITNFALRSVTWYGQFIISDGFRIGLVAVTALAALVAVWRMMRIELQFGTAPVAWPVFMLLAVAAALGVNSALAGPSLIIPMGLTLLTALLLFYLAVVIEARETIRYQLLLSALRKGRLGQAMTHAPMWGIPLILLALVMAAVGMVLGLDADSRRIVILTEEIPIDTRLVTSALPALMGFVLRDLMVWHVVTLGRLNWRSDWLGVVALILLYVFAPALIASLDAVDQLYWVLPQPPAWGGGVLTWIAPLIQTAGFAVLGVLLWRRHLRALAGHLPRLTTS